MSALFGELFQLGHVVPALGPAVAAWEGAGVGPFEVIEDYPVAEWRLEGEVVDVHVDVALAWSGVVQIELIRPNDAPSMYTEFLAASPDGGLQHYGFRCPDYDAALVAAGSAGWTVWMDGTLPSGRQFCYLRPPATKPGALPVEISSPPPPT